ncbi:MAG: DNA translocase FtsK [Spirochaetales bacterium]|nr:DNA translocase FtsK [Spirochaetales bacterium]
MSAYLAVSLVLSLGGRTFLLLRPGEFLYRCYHFSGFYVPLLLGAFAWIASRETLSRRLFFSLALSPLPFFTIALGEALIRNSGPAAQSLRMAFGLPMGLILLLLLTMIEVLIIFKGGEFFFAKEESPVKTRPNLSRWKDSLVEALGFSLKEELEDEPIPENRDTRQWEEESFEEDESLEWEDVSLEPLNVPDFPDPVEPVPEDLYGKEDDPVQEMIRQVLTGQNRREPRFPVVPPPPVMDEEYEAPAIDRLTPVEPEPVEGDPEVQHLNDLISNLDETISHARQDWDYEGEVEHLEEVAGESDYAVEPDFVVEPESLEEEERPLSVSEKLAPEQEEGVFTGSAAVPPRSRRKKGAYKVPVEGILAEYPDEGNKDIDDETRRAARILEETLREFKIEAEVTGISRGPVITMFELLPAPGVKLNRIVALQDNIALRLAASRVRIVAPIPGKHAVGIEIPNKKRSIVAFSDLVMCRDMKKKDIAVPIVLGEDISGDSQVIDLARTPHLLIAGATGAGKSVCVNSLICSILYHRDPDDVKMILVDPKIVELKLYNDIPHLLTPVITEPKRAFQAIQWALSEMERRYSLLDGMGVRDIKTYNKRILEREIATLKLPYIVLVIDEFADLMATSGKELEGIIARLAAMSRAVGIHLVLATQRPSTDVITGLIKANFPSRVAFMVASMTDSRIIIDSAGAEKLLGRGDMLFTSSWDPFPSRVQGAFLSEEEVERVVSYVKTLGEPEYIDDEIFVDEPDDDFELTADDGSDALFDEALDIVLQTGKASASYLQRRLKIGYNRAARLVEEMEMRGIVGPANGSKPRDILHVPN